MNVNRGISLKINTVFRSLRFRNYRLFFSGQSISLIGTWMQRIALPWLVYHMTGSALLLGVVGFAGQIPTFLIAPIAGALTDRWSRYRVLLVTQTLSLLQAGTLAWLSLAGSLDIWHIVVLSIIFGCINAFDVPARQSFVIEMVNRKEDLGNAIALNSMMFNGARLIGPTVAGIILTATGEGICFLLNAVSYLFVITSLLLMDIPHKKPVKKETHVIKDMKEGFNYIFGFTPIRDIILLLALISLMGASYQVLMPVYAKEILKGGSHTYGFLMGAAGLGALAGALFLASREAVIKLGRIIPVSATLLSAGLIILSFNKWVSFSLILMMFIGIGMMVNTAASNTILQTITDDDKRGRVMSFYTMSFMGTAPFGSLLVGWLAKTMGTPFTLMVGGVACLAGAMVFYKRLPALRKIIRPVYVRMGIIPEVAKGLQSASEPAIRGE
jgi:MFS family permease